MFGGGAPELLMVHGATVGDLLNEALPHAIRGVGLAIAEAAAHGRPTKELEALQAKLNDWKGKT